MSLIGTRTCFRGALARPRLARGQLYLARCGGQWPLWVVRVSRAPSPVTGISWRGRRRGGRGSVLSVRALVSSGDAAPRPSGQEQRPTTVAGCWRAARAGIALARRHLRQRALPVPGRRRLALRPASGRRSRRGQRGSGVAVERCKFDVPGSGSSCLGTGTLTTADKTGPGRLPRAWLAGQPDRP